MHVLLKLTKKVRKGDVGALPLASKDYFRRLLQYINCDHNCRCKIANNVNAMKTIFEVDVICK